MNIVLGVTGGIAAYKACELTSLALKQGHNVRVVLTRGASAFVGATTFAGLTGGPVLSDTFEDPMAHIEWARWADVICVAPATAHLLGKLANGLCDDLLSTMLLALEPHKSLVIAPAMNTQMWEHPAVQRNVALLLADGRARIVPPTAKRLACGEDGVGALADPEAILAACVERR